MCNVIRRTSTDYRQLNSGWGNHRVVVRVDQPADAVRTLIEWRRRDLEPEKTGIRVKHLDTGQEIKNVYIPKASREEGEIIFEAPYEGLYGIYYLPFSIKGKTWYFPEVQYMRTSEMLFDAAWKAGLKNDLPETHTIAIESRTDFDRFDPMEVPATGEEIQKLKSENSGKAFLLFPEERTYPIKMLKEIPQRWVEKGPSIHFNRVAQPGEYFVFQIGIWALHSITGLQVVFEQPENNKSLSDCTLTCFNTEGIDWLGRQFKQTLDIEADSVQPLWFGIDLPENISGKHEFYVKVITQDEENTVNITLGVEGDVLHDHGDSELWRLSRLRWLNSSIGIDADTAKGYTDMKVCGNRISCLGREVCFNDLGLPSAIRSYFSPTGNTIESNAKDIIASSIGIKVTSCNNTNNTLVWTANEGVQIKQVASGRVVIKAGMITEGLRGTNHTIMEYDGHIDTVITLTADKDTNMDNIQFLFPICKDAATYMMGMGKEGGLRPAEWEYEWDIDRPNNMVWIGSPHAGVQIKLKHTEDVWELYNYRKQGLPASWSNEGRGGCIISEKDDVVLLDAFTGPIVLKAGESISWRFSLLITPLKPVDTDAHWNQRYYHTDTWQEGIPSPEEAAKVGATIVNLHQGGPLNAYINYPFLKSEEIRQQVNNAHKYGLKYKLYYTVRELSNRAEELWMLRSLGDEVLRKGPGFHVADHFMEERHKLMTGGPWLCEHLVEGFIPAWQSLLYDGEYDSALAMSGLSRWHNHYIEGLAWLVRECGLDGIYLDGVGYDRQIMKRVRKALDSAGDGCLIDFHSGNNFEAQYGMNNPLNQYLELMPSVDSLWLGEGYDYENKPPDYWLVEVSGIPFGLMGDMLQGGGNPWRGMVFGMTCRYGWQQGGNPVPLWQFWESFGMIGSRMHGWWSDGCPVTTDNSNIKATVFIKPDQTLISIASWAPELAYINLNINWEYLGLSRRDTIIVSPEIESFQPAGIFEVDESIPVEQGKGRLLILESKC